MLWNFKTIINSNITFDYINFEHDKYNEEMFMKSWDWILTKNGYKVTIRDVTQRIRKKILKHSLWIMILTLMK